MIRQTLRAAAAALAVAAAAGPLPAQFTIKEGESDIPKQVAPAVAGLIDAKSVQLFDAKGALLCEVWFRKEVPSKATPEQVKNGLTYREIEETTLLGVLRVEKALNDYRKQKIKEGVYTVRLGYQPVDGDHQGTAPNGEFGVLIPVNGDRDPKGMEPKALYEKSTKASGSTHPAVFLLFPILPKAEAAAKLTKGMDNHWTVTRGVAVKAGGVTTTIGLVLTLVGVSSAA